MRHFSIALFCCVLFMVSLGCATGLNGGERVVKFRAGDDGAFADAPKAGKYVVAYRQAGSGELWQAKGTQRKVSKGDELGFTRDDMGRLVAIAGQYETTLGQMPIIAQYACWYRLPDDYDRNRQLRKNLRVVPAAIAAGTGEVLRGAGDLGKAAAEEEAEEGTPKWIKGSTRGRIK